MLTWPGHSPLFVAYPSSVLAQKAWAFWTHHCLMCMMRLISDMSWHHGLGCFSRSRLFPQAPALLRAGLPHMAALQKVATAPLLASSQNMPCRRARHVVTEQAGDGLRVLQTGVRDETEFLAQTFSNGIGYVQQGPRQIQAALSRVQRRIEESRLQALLEVGIAGMCKGVRLVACFRGPCWLHAALHRGAKMASSAEGGHLGAQGLL